MTRPILPQSDPKPDLGLEPVVDVPRKAVWSAWTSQDHVQQWFTPAPRRKVDCAVFDPAASAVL
jgi:uncharacterized protein YndB with AHSA1/START domain